MTYQLSPEAVAACNAVFAQNRHTVHQIIDAVAEATGIPAKRILGTNRDAPTARARQIVMYEARQAGLSYPQIARAMGKDHTTIIHGVRAEEQRRGA